MRLNINNEYSPLKKVAVCCGSSVPQAENYRTDDPEELKYGWKNWNKDLFLEQQGAFFDKLSQYGVEVVRLESDPELIHQAYTRDVGFVIGHKFFYAEKRTLKSRQGEIKKLIKTIKMSKDKFQALHGKIEGGDVIIVKDHALVGISHRTDLEAIAELSKFTPVKTLYLGEDIMHLDTRLTLLPNNYVLAYMDVFTEKDKEYLKSNYKIIEVTKEEAEGLATNVFVVNPETIFVEKKQERVANELRKRGFNIESLDYSEPIAIGGSFRCTTLPLVRES
ncbi:MAG: hypothetical protein JEZ06_12220 [Anaerolineaceae bacterium]|nr:hypothetical protein [Anaerolineaceae bacterium]